MEDWFKVYIGRLRENSERHALTIIPDFLEIKENFLQFSYPIELTAYYYLADQVLVCEWKIKTKFTTTCTVCGENFAYPLEIAFSHAEELANIPQSVFNFKDLLRDTILLHVPYYLECSEGNCPDRETLSAYLVKEKK